MKRLLATTSLNIVLFVSKLNMQCRLIYQTRGYKGWIVFVFQVFFCVFIDRKEVHVHIRAQKKYEVTIQLPRPNKLQQ